MFWWKKEKNSVAATTMSGQPHVLIVEDDPNNHLLFRRAFETVGFTVSLLGSADGDFADAVVGTNPDIISMDHRIGNRSGLEAVELLKADPRTKDLPVMMLTNFSDSEKIKQAKALGVTDYISLQAHAIQEVPLIFRRYLDDPEHFIPSHPFLQQR